MEHKDNGNIQGIHKMEGIGEICFLRSRSSRYLRISMKPFQGIRVTVPQHIPMEAAMQFVREKKSWIIRHAEKLSQKEKGTTIFRPGNEFKTRDHELFIHTHAERSIKIIVKSGGIHIFYPHFAPVEDPRVQQAVRKGITEAWRIEAGKYLPLRVKELSSAFGFSYGRLIFRDNKSRWGSCSRDNNISLHVQLMRLPQHLADYIILHELVHTVHKNHGPAFWQLLDKVTGNAKKLDKELNAYRLEIW